jgi:hypothetical protein
MRKAARLRGDAAKVALGERGPVWWDDGAPGFNRHLVRTTPMPSGSPDDRPNTSWWSM